MDLYSLDKFRKYKSDWSYPIQVRQKEALKDRPSSTFQSAMTVTMFVGQCFGLCPVVGICGNDAAKLRFTHMSWRCLYAYVSMVGQVITVGFLVASFFKSSMYAVDVATTMLFFTFALITSYMFLNIAKQWPKLSLQISKMEVADINMDKQLKKKFNMFCFTVMCLATLEHVFSELNSIGTVLDCHEGEPVYQAFVLESFPWIFTVIPYSTFSGVMFHAINIQCTFNWNYANLFVICMSLYLTSRLEQVNKRVVAAKDKNCSVSFWRTLREDYNKTTQLVRQVDSIIGGVIFISFASNLFFVCGQLLHTLAGGMKPSPRCNNNDSPDQRLFYGYEHSIYFAYSFLFLVGRSLAVSLTAARVHAASLEPAYALYDVSSASYCVEVERFLVQIHGNTVALTGLQFFNVKRGLVLTIAGTIVTYELVLLQFTGVTPSSSSTP